MRQLIFAALFLCSSLTHGAERQILSRGSHPGDGTGDTPWTMVPKINANDEELFRRTALITTNGLPSTNNVAQWRNALGVGYLVNVGTHPYNATGNGTTPDTVAIQAALDAVNTAGGGTIVIPVGSYLVDSLRVYSNTSIEGIPGKSILIQRLNAPYVLSINPGSAGSSNPAQNATNIMVRGITFQGRSVESGFSEHWHLLNMNAASHVLIENCRFLGSQGDGIYIGSGNTGGIERHNFDVKIKNCHFDGINNQNRNAISVIDVDGLIVEDCYFRRYSQVGMPGAIDCEPDSAFNVVRNVSVIRPDIDHIKGGYGVVFAVEGQDESPNLFNVRVSGGTFGSNNTFGGAAIAVRTADSSPVDMSVRIEANTITAPSVPILLIGVCGATVQGNSINGASTTLIDQYDSTNTVSRRVELLNNRWVNSGNSVGTVIVGNVQGLLCKGNFFDSTKDLTNAPAQVTFFGAPGVTTTSSGVHFEGNTFNKGASAITHAARLINHTTTATNNRYFANVTDVALESDLADNSNFDEVRLSDVKEITCSTLPDSIALGRSMAIVNADTNAPGVYKQGILVTWKLSNDPEYRKFVRQTFSQAANDGDEPREWFRNGSTSTNAWSEWTALRQDLPIVYTLTNTPSWFSIGTWTTAINGDTDAPDEYDQGTLVTYKPNADAEYRKFAIQIYYPAYNDPATLEKPYYYRRGVISDEWSAWQEGNLGGGASAVEGTVINTVAASGLLAVDAAKTNGIAATFAHITNALGFTPVNKAGDTISGALGVTGAILAGSQITMPNDTWLYGTNAAGNNVVAVIGLNTGDDVSIAPAGGDTTVGGALEIVGDLTGTNGLFSANLNVEGTLTIGAAAPNQITITGTSITSDALETTDLIVTGLVELDNVAANTITTTNQIVIGTYFTVNGSPNYTDNGTTLTRDGVPIGGGDLSAVDIDTSAELRGILGDESGTGALLFAGGAIGAATATTPSAEDNDTSVATTAWVQNELTNEVRYFEFALSDETTAITTGTAKLTWRAPFPFTLTAVRASVSTASSSGIPTVDINEGGVSVLSTKLTIDASEKTSTSAANAAVISDAAIADDAEVTFDIDVAGTGTTGLKVKLYYTR